MSANGISVRTYAYRFALIGSVAFIPFFLLGLLAGAPALFSLTVGYLLSFLFVGSNFIVAGKIDLKDHKRFYRLFLISLTLRFILVIAAIIFILKGVKIHQIYFTVSFIISYIFHSVTEIIFINRLLETDS